MALTARDSWIDSSRTYLFLPKYYIKYHVKGLLITFLELTILLLSHALSRV